MKTLTASKLLGAFEAAEQNEYPGLDYRQAAEEAEVLYGIAIGSCTRLRKNKDIVVVDIRKDDITESDRLVYRPANAEAIQASEAFKCTPEFQDFVKRHQRNLKCASCGAAIQFGDIIAAN
jgi:hypothetical protein